MADERVTQEVTQPIPIPTQQRGIMKLYFWLHLHMPMRHKASFTEVPRDYVGYEVINGIIVLI